MLLLLKKQKGAKDEEKEDKYGQNKRNIKAAWGAKFKLQKNSSSAWYI